jgi:hypothetical protein
VIVTVVVASVPCTTVCDVGAMATVKSVTVMVAVPDAVGSATEVAVKVTAPAGTMPGAV